MSTIALKSMMRSPVRAIKYVGAGAILVLLAACGGGGSSSNSSPASISGTAAQRSNLPNLSSAQYANAFVTRKGSQLMVAGQPFRFSGGNIEYLGLKNYGPIPSPTMPVGSSSYPTQFEVDDALATAHEMGITVVRAQTLGDTVGCPLCIEPAQGVFNNAAFAQMDMVVAEAQKYGIKLIGEFDGDANGTGAGNQSRNWWCTWRNISSANCTVAFLTNPDLIGDYERHIQAVLTHVNPLTGLAYKDDPTFLGWVDGNVLNIGTGLATSPSNAGLDGISTAVPDEQFTAWLTNVSGYFKSIDNKQLFIDNSWDLTLSAPAIFAVTNVDIYGEEWYPHWFELPPYTEKTTGNSPEMHSTAAQVVAAGKVYALVEYGWDNTDYQTTAALQTFLNGIASDSNISGDNFWALLGHATGNGWLPIPANEGCQPSCETTEDGNWWALYYTGITTLSNTAADMAQRAQMLRQHHYTLDGFGTVPAHELVGAPLITSTAGGRVQFQGAAGSPTYSVQMLQADGSWATPCQNCTTDAAGGWVDTTGQSKQCYRVVGVNLDGVPGTPSTPAGSGCSAAVANRQQPTSGT
jgi:mannan endo-1,4-beta-mannosidase